MSQNLKSKPGHLYENTLIITRGIDEAGLTADFFEEKGFQTICEPVVTLEILPISYQDLFIFDGYITTSQQALKALPDHEDLYKKPLLTFGQKTISMAQEQGFETIISGGKNAQEFAEFISENTVYQNQNLCYLRGEDISFPLSTFLKQHQIHITEKTAYKAHAIKTFSDQFSSQLERLASPLILLFSKRSAEIFFNLMPIEHLSKCYFGCFSKNIADFISKKNNSLQNHIFHADETNLDSLFDNMKRFLYSQMG